jgi:hypothetical protein
MIRLLTLFTLLLPPIAQANWTYNLDFLGGISGTGTVSFSAVSGKCDVFDCSGTQSFDDLPTVNMLITSVVTGNSYTFTERSFLNTGFQDDDSFIEWKIDPNTLALSVFNLESGVGSTSEVEPNMWLGEITGDLSGVTVLEAKCPEDCDGFVDHREQTSGQITATYNPPLNHDDLVVSFARGAGTWRWVNNANWVQVHSGSSQQIGSGDFDGDGAQDIVVSFGPDGTWISWNDGSWTKLHNLPADQLTVNDLDSDGLDDIIISFRPPNGIWIWMNNSDWKKLHDLSAKGLAS